MGEDDPIIAELRRSLENRRQRDMVLATLQALDRAVAEEDEDGILGLVHSPDHASALISLMGKPGLIFDHRLDKFDQQDQHISAIIVLHHALENMPEADLRYRYKMTYENDRWIIAEVEML